MYKNNKKGFSLIELLAVVIILAVLALILIPFIGNLIKQAKINAAVVSAYGYVEAANNEIVSRYTRGDNLLETQYDIKDYNIVDGLLNVRYEGRGPEKGWFNISRVKVSNGVFCINGYEIKYENGKAVYDPDGLTCAPPPRPTICRITDITNPLDYTETTEFEIATVEDLVCLSDLVNSSKTFEGKTITLTNDIDFNSDKSYNDPSGILDGHSSPIKTEVTTGFGFTPIGNSNNPFKGTFTSSNFNKISNLYINRPSQNNIGLFGCLGSGSIIEGINLEKFKVNGREYVGGVVGKADYGTIRYINVDDVRVSGVSEIGGLVGGVSYDGSGPTIKEVVVRGTITGTDLRIGGV